MVYETNYSIKIAPFGAILGILFRRGFGGFFGRSFFWLVFAKLVGVFRLFVFFGRFFIPGGEVYPVFLEDESDTRRRLGTAFKIELELFFVEDGGFGFWVVVADLSHNAPRKRVTLGFLDDYPIHREVSTAITLHANREHFFSLNYYFPIF